MNLSLRYLLWLSLSVWFAFIFLYFLPGFSYEWIFSLFFLLIIGLSAKNKKPYRQMPGVLFFIFLIPLFLQSYFLIYQEGEWLKVFHPNNLGDLPFHIHLSTFLQNASLWPDNPIYHGEKLNYAFASNLFHAIFLDSPLDKLNVFILFSIIFLIVTSWLSFQIGGLFFFILVFFSSGWGLIESEVIWKPLFSSSYLTQRAYIFALPFGLIWLKRIHLYLYEKKDFSFREVLLYSFLFGSLGFFHYHAALSLGVLSIFFFLLKAKKNLFLIGLFSFLIGAFFPIRAALSSDFTPYWQLPFTKEGGFFFQNYFLNFGPYLVVMFYSIYKYKKLRLPLSFFLCLFLLFQMWIFAPWPWDNVKLMIWPYLASLLWLSSELKKESVKKVFILLLLSGPGIFIIFVSTFLPAHDLKVWQSQELKHLEKILVNKENKVFWVHPAYNHPIFYFGKKVFMGYPGHLWSHGIDYQKRRKTLLDAKKEGSSRFEEVLSKMEVDYILYSSIEKKEYDSQFFQDFRLDSQVNGLRLYILKRHKKNDSP